MSGSPATLVGVFAKFWQPGHVKTRLAAEVGGAAAAELSRALLQATVAQLESLAEQQVVCFAPRDRQMEFREAIPPAWELWPQVEGDLGRRIEAFFDRAFSGGKRRAVLLGSDAPNVPREYVARAVAELENAAVVLGPAQDGGYYLVAARDRPPPIFRDIDWSTPLVWQQTLEALHKAGLGEGHGYVTLPEWYDIDTLDDLRKLRSQIADCPEENLSLSRLAGMIDRVLGNG